MENVSSKDFPESCVSKQPCVVEPAVRPPKSGNMTSLPGRIWERKDLLILVTGTLGCTRGIYKIGRKQGKLHQLDFCLCDAEDYKSGKFIARYAAKINELLKRQDLGGIIIYASCLDSLARLNLTKLRPLLDNPQNIPVELLLRGPVSSSMSKIKPIDKLEEILSRIPKTEKVLDESMIPLAPQLPDFVGIGNMLQDWPDTYNMIFEIGGCSACISLDAADIEQYNLRKTTFNGYASLIKYSDSLVEAVKQDRQALKKEDAAVYITNAAVVANAGIQSDKVTETLLNAGIRATYLPATAYASSVHGRANAILALTEKIREAKQPEHKMVGLLGSEAGSPAPMNKIHHGLEHLEWDNYKALTWQDVENGYVDKLGKVTVNWVTSFSGLPAAQYMQKKFGTPYFVGVPMGMDGMKAWRNKLYTLMDDPDLLLSVDSAKNTEDKRSILLIGDPVLTAGIADHLSFLGYRDVERAVQVPFANEQQWYQNILNQIQPQNCIGDNLSIAPHYFADGNELKAIAMGYDVIVADSVYAELLSKALTGTNNHKQYIVIPDNEFSRGLAGITQPEYMIFGKKGAAWLEGQLGLL